MHSALAIVALPIGATATTQDLVIALTGNNVPSNPPIMTLSPGAGPFALASKAGSVVTQPITLTNHSSQPVQIASGITNLPSFYYTLDSTCNATLPVFERRRNPCAGP